MLINKIEDLNGCLKNDAVCTFCIGQTIKFPTTVFCSRGHECSRGECCFHRTCEQILNEIEMGGR